MGLVMIRAHWRAWQQHRQADEPVPADELGLADRAYLHKRFRRRMQTSAGIILVGVLLPVGDFVIPWQRLANGPQLFTLYWGGVLLITLWIILMAMGDLTMTRLHSRSTLDVHRAHVRELEQQVAELRSRGSNGRHSPPERG